MKSILLSCLALFFCAIVITSCEKDNNDPLSENNVDQTTLLAKKKPNNGNGKGNPPPPPPPAPEINYTSTYQVVEIDEFDALYRFSFNDAKDLILLETDPTITTWGTDNWGFWDEPYYYDNANGVLQYFIGLSNVTYEFTPLPGNRLDVTKILIVQPYPSGTPTTTISHPGVYELVP